MTLNQTNQEMMLVDFPTIAAEAHLQAAYLAIKKNLEGPPHTPGIVVLDQEGKYVGLLTVDDLLQELHRLYLDACDQPGKKGWFEPFFDQCEIMALKQVSQIMSGKHLSVQPGDAFEKSCELVLSKKSHLLAVVDANSKPVGIITRRQVLVEIASRMFK
jgi:predicted transcriptional regulator